MRPPGSIHIIRTDIPVALRIEACNRERKKKKNHHLHYSSSFSQAITFLMRLVRNYLLPRCQCRCHGIESNVHVVSTESHRQMSIDRIILNYRVSNRSGMTLIPKVSEERTQIGETERDDKKVRREFLLSWENKFSKYFSPAPRFTVLNCNWFYNLSTEIFEKKLLQNS